CLSDARIRKHPREALLRQRRNIPQSHRQDGDYCKGRRPVQFERYHCDDENPEERSEAAVLRSCCKECSNSNGRTLIRIGYPHVKWHCSHFHSEPRDKEHHS